ncbi:hypothetical protein BDV24DRAFT_100694 [Aspergillus arachidicola]|uniref:Uncharacterized protein n=1 Tax=Aspergillus arachidicola TaxID=656916 RepID=A0A5N6YN11_9EURO|nr:hypothetical protein BDV24DRAFT_100694 [Aspergillus arachidicola]
MPQTAHCMPFDTHSNTLVCVLMLVHVLLIDWLGVDEYRINIISSRHSTFDCIRSACFVYIFVYFSMFPFNGRTAFNPFQLQS